MDRVNKDNSDHPGELPTEILDATPILWYDNKGMKTVLFGNTGFTINFDLASKDKAKSTFDFTPEGAFGFRADKAAKNASILSTALLGIYNFLNDTDTLKRFGLPISEIGETSAITNERLVLAIKELFSENGHEELVKAGHFLNEVTINLNSFRSLDKNDALLIYLKRVNDRAKNLLVRKSNLIV